MDLETHEESDGWLGAWCAWCGPEVSVDEDGLCSHCGATAVGPGADEALLALRRQRDDYTEIFTWRVGFAVLVLARVIVFLATGW